MLVALELACELVEVAACELELVAADDVEVELCDVAELVTALELACEATELDAALVATLLLALAVEVLLDCAATELLEAAWLVLLALVTDELVAAAEVACELVEVAALVVDLALLALAVVVVFLVATASPVLTPGISMVWPAMIKLGLLKPFSSAIFLTETLYFCEYAQTVSPALIVNESALATAWLVTNKPAKAAVPNITCLIFTFTLIMITPKRMSRMYFKPRSILLNLCYIPIPAE